MRFIFVFSKSRKNRCCPMLAVRIFENSSMVFFSAISKMRFYIYSVAPKINKSISICGIL